MKRKEPTVDDGAESRDYFRLLELAPVLVSRLTMLIDRTRPVVQRLLAEELAALETVDSLSLEYWPGTKTLVNVGEPRPHFLYDIGPPVWPNTEGANWRPRPTTAGQLHLGILLVKSGERRDPGVFARVLQLIEQGSIIVKVIVFSRPLPRYGRQCAHHPGTAGPRRARATWRTTRVG